MDASVFRKVSQGRERLPADVTHVRSVSTVCPAVILQLLPPRERLATVVTAEWPLPRVCSLVTRHILLVVRGELAPLTLVSAVPADVAVTLLHVLLQMILSQTGIVAVATAMYLRLHAFTW